MLLPDTRTLPSGRAIMRLPVFTERSPLGSPWAFGDVPENRVQNVILAGFTAIGLGGKKKKKVLGASALQLSSVRVSTTEKHAYGGGGRRREKKKPTTLPAT